MSGPDADQSEVAVKGSFWHSAKMVAWAFVGIRKGSEYRQDFGKVNPLHVIVVGVIGAALFVLALVALVSWVVPG